MLNLEEVTKELELKREEFTQHEKDRSEEASTYHKHLAKLAEASDADNETLPKYSGAKILEDGDIIRPFGMEWKSRAEALEWVDGVLAGTPVGACDGSQVYPAREIELPLGLVQASKIYNRHTDSKDYFQESRARLLTPEDFRQANIFGARDSLVDAERFRFECEMAIELMEEKDDVTVLFDGPLLLSHINLLQANLRNMHAEAVKEMLAVSERTQNPIVGYLDHPGSRDIVTMMRHLFGLEKASWLTDSHLLLKTDLAQDWGARTKLFLSDRDDRRKPDEGHRSALDLYGPFRDKLAFFYMALSGELPVRIEVPLWVHEKEQVDRVADILRAEVVLKGDYPDILYRAHEKTVITAKEGRIFMGVVEGFCAEKGIRLHRSRKSVQKRFGR